jgi:two-component system sensor histidine kinase BaeS
LWRCSITWKLVLINGLVIATVIWFTGVSVKDFACFLVNQYRVSGDLNKDLFNNTMQEYLIRASIIAVVVAAVIHYYFVRQIVRRLQHLGEYARKVTTGVYPAPLQERPHDEIGGLTKDFNRMVVTLRQTEESRKQMISDISHELRTPLSNIKGYLEALNDGVITGSKEIYGSLHEEALHLSRLVDQLHQLSTWQAKTLQQIELREIEIPSFIEAVVRQFDMELQNHQIECRIKMHPGVVLADPVGLKQVMGNLLMNAIQYDEGRRIEINGSAENKCYTFTVTNIGREIAPENAERIFERFYRLEPSRNRESGGSGLGLAIAKEIVTRHGGRIGLSTDGKRHSFWFILPLSQ